MVRIRDVLLTAALALGLAAGVATYRLLAGPTPVGDVLLGPPAAALLPGLVLGAAAVGLEGRSRIGAAVGGAAGATLAGLHAGAAQAAGASSLVVLAAGGVASGLGAYLGYQAMLPPEGDGDGDGG
jgi:hypothetical protein